MESSRAIETAKTDLPWWIWLFPATYALHIAEEYWGGEGFAVWASRLARTPLTEDLFLSLNAVGLAAMIFCTALAARRTGRWLLASSAAIELSNGILHAVASAVTQTYSPGLLTGLLFWVPLGGLGLVRLRHRIGDGYWAGAAGGLLFQAALSAAVLAV